MQESHLSSRRNVRRPLLLAGLVLYAFAFQGSRSLWEPDEGRYTAVALEMERLGDYVSPHLHHEVKHLSKPPLTYWLLAASLELFGSSEWAGGGPRRLAQRPGPGESLPARLDLELPRRVRADPF